MKTKLWKNKNYENDDLPMQNKLYTYSLIYNYELTMQKKLHYKEYKSSMKYLSWTSQINI